MYKKKHLKFGCDFVSRYKNVREIINNGNRLESDIKLEPRASVEVRMAPNESGKATHLYFTPQNTDCFSSFFSFNFKLSVFSAGISISCISM